MGKDDPVLARREQLLSFWLFRRAVPPARPQKFTLAWALTLVNWYARRRHHNACRLADVEDDKLLCLALAGDTDASIRLSTSSYSDPRRRNWQNWNPVNRIGTLIRAAFLLICFAMVIYNVGSQVYAVTKWGVERLPEALSVFPAAQSPRRQ